MEIFFILTLSEQQFSSILDFYFPTDTPRISEVAQLHEEKHLWAYNNQNMCSIERSGSTWNIILHLDTLNSVEDISIVIR